MTVRQQIIPPVIFIAGVISFGTIGYIIVEGWGVFDALYMNLYNFMSLYL